MTGPTFSQLHRRTPVLRISSGTTTGRIHPLLATDVGGCMEMEAMWHLEDITAEDMVILDPGQVGCRLRVREGRAHSRILGVIQLKSDKGC